MKTYPRILQHKITPYLITDQSFVMMKKAFCSLMETHITTVFKNKTVIPVERFYDRFWRIHILLQCNHEIVTYEL